MTACYHWDQRSRSTSFSLSYWRTSFYRLHHFTTTWLSSGHACCSKGFGKRTTIIFQSDGAQSKGKCVSKAFCGWCWSSVNGMVLLRPPDDMQKLLVKNAAHSLMVLILISSECYHWLPAERGCTWTHSLCCWGGGTDEHKRSWWSQRPVRSHWRNRSFLLIWKIHNTLILIMPHKNNRYLSPNSENCCSFFRKCIFPVELIAFVTFFLCQIHIKSSLL